MQRRWGIAVVIGFVWIAAARADDESDRRSLLERIDSLLDRLPGQIRDLGAAPADRVSDRASKKACEAIARGTDNPDVRRALDELGRDLGSVADSYKNLRDEYRRWYEQVKQLYNWSDQDVEEIRRAFCAAPDAGEWAEVNAVADRWASQLRSQYGTVTGTADRLKKLADDLTAKGRAKKGAPKTKDAIDRVLASIASIKDYQLLGANNPMVKARADFGTRRHAELQGSCDEKEIVIDKKYCDTPSAAAVTAGSTASRAAPSSRSSPRDPKPGNSETCNARSTRERSPRCTVTSATRCSPGNWLDCGPARMVHASSCPHRSSRTRSVPRGVTSHRRSRAS